MHTMKDKKRKGGMMAADGATGLRRMSVNLDAETIRVLRELGSGNLSAGIRAAARAVGK